MTNRLPIIAVTPGDCTGIGPEQLARILADRRMSGVARLVVVGDRRVVDLGMRQAGVAFDLRHCDSPAAVDWSDGSVPMVHNGNTDPALYPPGRSEEHTSELQSLMRTSCAVCRCQKKKPTIYTAI